ncbi:hypothetical protein NLI96_g7150 [Meripilus lineatus]|uniref:Uncharacterized protein n=1 Tax=Meripilus lineatus TaxID=2056292 RepID=A0AAD5UZP3_9APHY|nr:hypothetical protein NLI96_g7150 [Physisporinus lineatus]
MQLTTGPPLLFALGIRILLNLFDPEHTPSTSDYLLQGLWQGVLLYHTLIHFQEWVLAAAFGIGAKFVYDIGRGLDTTKCASTLLGVALGVLVTNVLSMVIEDSSSSFSIISSERTKDRTRTLSGNLNPAPAPQAHEPMSRRLRLVSFDRSRRRTQSHPTRHEPNNPRHAHDHARRDAISPAPTLAYSIDTAPSISIDSVSSSIDPKGNLSPQERQVAILRARASLADSERRRFKEERKWALSTGNKARASQLAWQVKRYAALMESYHREADAKIVEAARAAAPQASSVPFPQAGPSTQRQSQPQAQTQAQQQQPAKAGPSNSTPPLISVTVGTQAQTTRVRKRSGGAISGSTLRPAIHIHSREYVHVSLDEH